jgi:histidinol phosphatase-like PHP family hydrolase
MTEPIKINFHMHSTGSDGKMKPEEVVQEAIAAGIKYMCFTDHYETHMDTLIQAGLRIDSILQSI